MSGSLASGQTVERYAEADDQKHASGHRQKPLPLDGFGEFSLDAVMGELNFAVAGLDRHALLDLVGAGMLGAVEVRPAHLARIEQDHIEPSLFPLRRVPFEASRYQFGIAAEAQRHWQGNVVPAAAECVAMDGEGKIV